MQKDSPTDRPTREEAEAAVRTLIRWAGEDPDRPGLVDTPRRVTEAYAEFFAGYSDDETLDDVKLFADEGGFSDMVLVRDIQFASHCEHHMVPFLGKAHIAYVPGGQIVGLSKLARVVDLFAKRLQTQENLSAQIVAAVERIVKPRGMALLMEAEHMCMTMRGARKPGARMVTTQFSGCFVDEAALQARFITLVRAQGG
jgi:GTP cyclohydrolase I